MYVGKVNSQFVYYTHVEVVFIYNYYMASPADYIISLYIYLLTLGAHAQRGLQQLYMSCESVRVSVCLSVCNPYSSKLSNKASYQRFQRL